jgi:hypothetical protein
LACRLHRLSAGLEYISRKLQTAATAGCIEPLTVCASLVTPEDGLDLGRHPEPQNTHAGHVRQVGKSLIMSEPLSRPNRNKYAAPLCSTCCARTLLVRQNQVLLQQL